MKTTPQPIPFIRTLIYAFAFTCSLFILIFLLFTGQNDAQAGIGVFIFLIVSPGWFIRAFAIVWPCFESFRILWNHKKAVNTNETTKDLAGAFVLPVMILIIGLISVAFLVHKHASGNSAHAVSLKKPALEMI